RGPSFAAAGIAARLAAQAAMEQPVHPAFLFAARVARVAWGRALDLDPAALLDAHVFRHAHFHLLAHGAGHALGDLVRDLARDRVRDHLANRVRHLLALLDMLHVAGGIRHLLDAVFLDRVPDSVGHLLDAGLLHHPGGRGYDFAANLGALLEGP